MRIITGKARGKRLLTLEGEATRPTSERAKEAIFSTLQFDIEGRRVLDLFGGSGQMALEALSRGASAVDIVDKSPEAIKIIKDNIKNVGLFGAEAFCSDYESYLRSARGKVKYDLVFLDPPYAMPIIPKVLAALADGGFLKSSSIIVCESGSPEIFSESDAAVRERFEVTKQVRYGVAHITYLSPKSE